MPLMVNFKERGERKSDLATLIILTKKRILLLKKISQSKGERGGAAVSKE